MLRNSCGPGIIEHSRPALLILEIAAKRKG
jgi:hypothetical protein